MNIKNDFPIFKNHPLLAYLDSAATSQVPQLVIRILEEYHEEYRANVHRGMYAEATHTSLMYEEARKKVADFVRAQPNEIIFTAGATASFNMLMRMFEDSGIVGEGDVIVTSIMEHHSALLPFRELARRKHAHLSVIPLTKTFDLDLSNIETRIPETTKLVVITLASNVLGTVNDVRPIVDRAHELGALVIIDAAKAASHIPIEVSALDCDFLVFSGHKMFGPSGIGVLYGKADVLAHLEPGFYGGGMVANVTEEALEYAPVPEKFEAGTPPIAGAIGLGAAIDYLTSVGVEHIHTKVTELVSYGIDRLNTISGLSLYAQHDALRNAGVLTFTVEGIHSHDVAQVLADEQVAVRAGHHCAIPLMRALGLNSTVRASFHGYNTTEDIDRLIAGIEKVQKIFA
jgi:cysteine desulfurase / selenocysteine lyase